MMYIKKINKLIFLFFLIVIIFPTIKMKAVESYEYSVYFDYELIQKRNFSSSVIKVGNNVSFAKIKKANGLMSDLSLSLYTNKSINSNVLKNNSYISFTDFTIEVNTEYSSISILLQDEDYNPIYEANDSSLYIYDLIDQKYYITITCQDSYSETINKVFINNTLTITFAFYVDTVNPTGSFYNDSGNVISGVKTNASYIIFNASDDYSGINYIKYVYENDEESSYDYGEKLYNEGTYKFYCIDNAGNRSNNYTITIDKSKPHLIIQNAVAYSDINNPFSVSIEDNNTAYLYYKSPIMSVFNLAVSNKINITETMPKGLYYFYAIDNFNNKTNEVWINYGGENPKVKINNIESSNSVFITWDIEGLKVLLNNKDYVQESIITEEGSYELVILDDDNNTSILYFDIICYYLKEKTIESTCIQEGYTIYRCISCDNIKYDDYTSKGVHNYNHYFLDATCVNKGGMYYYCIYCNYNYIVNQIPPLGHTLNYQIVDSSCETEGIRIIKCENCEYYLEEIIPSKGHKYILLDSFKNNNKIISQYMCEQCMNIIEKEENDQNELLVNFVSFLKNKYFPYLVWILIGSVSVWSIMIGFRIIFLKHNDEQVLTKNMIRNYIFGIVVIFILIAAVPLLIQGLSLI